MGSIGLIGWIGSAKRTGAFLKLRPPGYTGHLPSFTRNNLINCWLRGAGGGHFHQRRRPAQMHKKKAGKAREPYRPCALTGLEDPSASGTPIPSRVIAFCDAHGFFPTPETASAMMLRGNLFI